MASGRKIGGRREEIVEATLELLASTSLEGLSTRQIAKTIGVSQPALFRHFLSRDALLVAVITRARGALEQMVQEVLGSGRPPLEQLRMVAQGILRQVKLTPGLPRLLFADALGEGGVRSALKHLVSMQMSLSAELFRQALREGAVRDDLDPLAAAGAYVAVIQGAVFQWQVADRTDDLEALAAPLLEFVLDAARSGNTSRPASTGDARADAVDSPPSGFEPLDVRTLLSRGIDPLGAILEAVTRAGPTGVVALTVPFRPVPLLTLLRSRGHQVVDRECAGGLWSVDVVVGGAPAILELSDLEPPEPMERVLEASAQLASGGVIIARLPRFPRLLIPALEQRALAWRLHEAPDGTALLRVTRRP